MENKSFGNEKNKLVAVIDVEIAKEKAKEKLAKDDFESCKLVRWG